MNQRGIVMALSIVVVAVLATLGAAFMSRSLNEDRLGQRTVGRQAAFYLAEAGIDRAIAELRTNPAWSGVSYTPTTGVTGGYEVAVTTLSPTLRRLTSIGHVPSNVSTAPWYQQRQLETIVDVVSPSVFQFALFGNERVRMKVNDEDDDSDNDDNERPDAHVLIDSYNSSLGTYLSQTPGQEGDIGTNNTAGNTIRLQANTGEGSITVQGQVEVGPNLPDPSTAVDVTGNVTITGTPQIVSQTQTMPLPAVTVPSTCSGGGDMKLKNGETLTLFESASPYCYTKLDLKNQSSIVVQGNVVIYTGELTVQHDSQVNTAGKPTQLLIQVTTNKKVKLQDEVRVAAGIYAPQSKAKVKDNVVLYGALVASRIKMKHGATIHFDEALANVGPSIGNADPRLRSWREP